MLQCRACCSTRELTAMPAWARRWINTLSGHMRAHAMWYPHLCKKKQKLKRYRCRLTNHLQSCRQLNSIPQHKMWLRPGGLPHTCKQMCGSGDPPGKTGCRPGHAWNASRIKCKHYTSGDEQPKPMLFDMSAPQVTESSPKMQNHAELCMKSGTISPHTTTCHRGAMPPSLWFAAYLSSLLVHQEMVCTSHFLIFSEPKPGSLGIIS